MNYYLSALLALYAVLGLSGGDAGKMVRFSTVAMPLYMVHAIDVHQGNKVVHWHLF